MSLIKRLSYNARLKKMASVLHLNGIARDLYYRLARPSEPTLTVPLAGIPAAFHVRCVNDLRMVEGQGSEAETLAWFLSRLNVGDVALDVGASIGLYTIAAARAVGTHGFVMAFEPESGSYEKLCDNVRLNGLANVRCFRKGLGATDAREMLTFSAGREYSASIVRAARASRPQEVIEVVRGDAFLRAQKLPPPRAVKIDVEGYEYNVLVGLRETLGAPTCETLCCEIHPRLLKDPSVEQRVVELLRGLGFAEVLTRRRGDQMHCLATKTRSGE